MIRNELKFILSNAQAELIQRRLAAVMESDTHAGPGGSYAVRSLYFDNRSFDFYNSSLSGQGQRCKYRLRIYNGQTDLIRAEIKQKQFNFVEKSGAGIDFAAASDLICGMVPEIHSDSAESFFYARLKAQNLKPVCIVEYSRRVFVSEPGNVRISFDTGILGSADTAGFLTGEFTRQPLLQTPAVIMEVKYDDILPGYIARLLNTGELSVSGFSKYVLAIQSCKNIFVKNS